MRFSFEIPDNVVSIARADKNIGRRTLAAMTGVPDWKVRIYLDVLRNGTLIHVEQPKLNVESGKTLKALLLPDIHWPYHDQRALDAAGDFMVTQRPIIGGVVR